MKRFTIISVLTLIVLMPSWVSAEWVWTNPKPTGNNMNGIYYRGPNDVVFAGTGGTIMEWDGAEFMIDNPYWQADFNAIAEVPGKGLVAVCSDGTVMVWNNGSWSLDAKLATFALNSIWVSSSGKAFVTTDQEVIFHWTGNQWSHSVVPIGPPGSPWDNRSFHAIWGTSDEQVYTASWGFSDIYEWDGLEWRYHSTDCHSYAYNLCGTASGELYTAGSKMCYFDGDEWFDITPEGIRDFVEVKLLESGDLLALHRTGTIYIWDGVTWTTILEQDLGYITGAWLQSESEMIVCTRGGDIYHWTGGSSVNLNQKESFTEVTLFETWCVSRNDAYVVGSDSTVLHWDGVEWQTMAVPVDDVTFNAVWAADASNVYVGGYSNEGYQMSVVLYWDGFKWEELPSSSSSRLTDLWGFGKDDLILGSSSFLIKHWDGTTWTDLFSVETTAGGAYVWGTSSDDFFVAATSEVGGPGTEGTSGDLYHWDGSNREYIYSTAARFYGIWGAGSDDVYMGGVDNIHHYDGEEINEVYTTDTGLRVQSIFGFDANTVFATSGTDIYTWDGYCWRRQKEFCGKWLGGIGGADHNYLYAVGGNGTILHGNSVVDLGVEIAMPTDVQPREDFYIMGYLNNPGEMLTGVQVYFILDIYGELYFWDDWTHYNPPESTEIDFVTMDVSPGTTPVVVVPRFEWPDIDGHAYGLYTYGGMVDPVAGTLIGDYAAVQWRY